MTLEEYAKAHPMDKPEGEAETMEAQAEAIQRKRDATERADELKEELLRQIKNGTPPHISLYTAIDIIGVVTNDTEWKAEAEGIFCDTYTDIHQQAALTRDVLENMRKLQEMQEAFIDAARKKYKSMRRDFERMDAALNTGIKALDMESLREQDKDFPF